VEKEVSQSSAVTREKERERERRVFCGNQLGFVPQNLAKRRRLEGMGEVG